MSVSRSLGDIARFAVSWLCGIAGMLVIAFVKRVRSMERTLRESSLNLHGDAVLGRNRRRLGEVHDGADTGVLGHAKCVDPRLRLVNGGEVA